MVRPGWTKPPCSMTHRANGSCGSATNCRSTAARPLVEAALSCRSWPASTLTAKLSLGGGSAGLQYSVPAVFPEKERLAAQSFGGYQFVR